MSRLLLVLLALASCAPAFAADPTKPSRGQAAAYTGTAVVLVGDERTEFVTARASAAFALTSKVGIFARAELGGTQDGGGLDFGDRESFRAVEALVGARYAVVGPLRVSALAGTTLSVEGDEGAPVDARLYTLGGTVGLPFLDGGYVEAGGAWDERVGGAALLFAASVPIRGAYTVLDVSVPIRKGALDERAYQVRIGAQVRVKKLLF